MKKVILILPYLVIGVLAWMYFDQLSEFKKFKLQNEKLTVKQEHNENEIARLKLLEEADDLFFGGNIDEAFKKYRVLDSLSNSKNSLAKERVDWLKGIDETQAEMANSSLKQNEEIVRLQESLSVFNEQSDKKLQENDLLNVKISQLEKRLINQYDSLQKSFIREKESFSKNASVDTLSFKSSKNYTVRYYGQISNKQANGIGSASWSTSGYYYGAWKNNMRHGKGKYYWKDGEVYEGDFVNDKRDGIGKYSWSNGSKYEGSWKNDMRNGFGILYDEMGKVKFKGEWVNDTPSE